MKVYGINFSDINNWIVDGGVRQNCLTHMVIFQKINVTEINAIELRM